LPKRIPDAINDIIPALNIGMAGGPHYLNITTEWFTQSMAECPSAKKAHAKDLVFIMTRCTQEPMPSLTLFNQKTSTVNPEQTSVGYLPIIQTPPHDIDTLNTVVSRVLHVARSLKRNHVVLTVDEGLYPS
jgi:hypothetical protein